MTSRPALGLKLPRDAADVGADVAAEAAAYVSFLSLHKETSLKLSRLTAAATATAKARAATTATATRRSGKGVCECCVQPCRDLC